MTPNAGQHERLRTGGRPKGRRYTQEEPPERAAATLRLIIRLIQFVLWVAFATWLGRKLLGWFFGEAGRSAERSGPAAPGVRHRATNHRQDAGGTKGSKLHRDPACGTHVPEAISFPLELQGEVQHFCSVECREKFRATARATPSSSRGFGSGAASA